MQRTVVSEKICELVLERSIYLRKFKNKLCSKQKFLRVLSTLQWCLFETPRIIIIEVRNFAPLCIKMGGSFCITAFDVLRTF